MTQPEERSCHIASHLSKVCDSSRSYHRICPTFQKSSDPARYCLHWLVLTACQFDKETSESNFRSQIMFFIPMCKQHDKIVSWNLNGLLSMESFPGGLHSTGRHPALLYCHTSHRYPCKAHSRLAGGAMMVSNSNIFANIFSSMGPPCLFQVRFDLPPSSPTISDSPSLRCRPMIHSFCDEKWWGHLSICGNPKLAPYKSTLDWKDLARTTWRTHFEMMLKRLRSLNP